VAVEPKLQSMSTAFSHTFFLAKKSFFVLILRNETIINLMIHILTIRGGMRTQFEEDSEKLRVNKDTLVVC
jgi:hypothetical protein